MSGSRPTTEVTLTRFADLSNLDAELDELIKMTERNMRICVWCGNRMQEVCMVRCQEEGRYRYLEPEPLPGWEQPPELPPFRELLDLSASERLAFVYLDAHYRDKK